MGHHKVVHVSSPSTDSGRCLEKSGDQKNSKSRANTYIIRTISHRGVIFGIGLGPTSGQHKVNQRQNYEGFSKNFPTSIWQLRQQSMLQNLGEISRDGIVIFSRWWRSLKSPAKRAIFNNFYRRPHRLSTLFLAEIWAGLGRGGRVDQFEWWITT